MSIKPRPGRVIYENDLILSEIINSLDSKQAIRNLMLTSKRNFAVGTKALYKEVNSDIMVTLGKKNCFLRHITVYLEAVRTLVYPVTREQQKMYPRSFDIPALRQTFPNLNRIKFVLPHSINHSCITLFDPPLTQFPFDSSSFARANSSTGILGNICLVLDGDRPPPADLYSDDMAVHGSRARFHLVGLHLGVLYTRPQEYRVDYALPWVKPLGPLIPQHCAAHPNDFKHIQERSWNHLLKHLTELCLTNGCASRHVVALIGSTPALKRLAFYSRGYSSDVLDTEERSHSLEGVLARLETKLEDRVELEALSLGSAMGYHPRIDDGWAVSARHIVARWDLADMVSLNGMSPSSIDSWKEDIEEMRLPEECDTITLSLPHNCTDKNPFTVGLALSMMLPHRVKFDIHKPNVILAEHQKKWIEHVREGRLYGIQVLEKDHKPGFRQLRQPPEEEHRCSTPDSAYSDGNESCCIEYSNPHVREEADEAWERLTLSEKMKVLKKGGVSLWRRSMWWTRGRSIELAVVGPCRGRDAARL